MASLLKRVTLTCRESRFVLVVVVNDTERRRPVVTTTTRWHRCCHGNVEHFCVVSICSRAVVVVADR